MNDEMVLKSILFVATNPKSTQSLRLHEEDREIKDIQQVMLYLKPQIVHFGG